MSEIRGDCFRCVALHSHRCRNQWIGDRPCPDGLHFEEYIGSTVRQCLCATIEIFQDGYIQCPIMDCTGCEKCMERFGDGSNFRPDESQNYERKPRWRKKADELAKKKLSAMECLDALVLDLKNEFDRWDHISKNGSQDPNWPDGVNMNLVHNHILYSKSNMEKICTENSLELPEIYHREAPPEVDRLYMVRGYVDEWGRAVRDEKEEESTKTCETCSHSEDYGESVEYIKCAEGKKRKAVKKKQKACNKYMSAPDVIDDETEGDLEEQLDRLLKDGDENQKDTSNKRHCGDCYVGHWYSEDFTYVNVVSDDGMKTTKRPCEPHTHYCYQFAEGQKKIASDKDFNPLASPVWCPLRKVNDEICDESKKNSGSGSCASGMTEDTAISNAARQTVTTASASNELNQKEENELISEKQKCKYGKRDCTCYCAHNDGCCVLLIYGEALKDYLERYSVDCDVFNSIKEKEFGTGDENTALEAPASTAVQPFDYSTVDEETAGFLQEKANKITEIRIKSVIALGKELKEAQDKLANHNGGTFVAWFESIGFKKDTVYRNINAYEWVFANCENVELADNIQPSLLFAASKPSAPKELSDKVASGDIKTHKEYKVLEDKLKVAEKIANQAEDKWVKEHQEKAKFEKELNSLKSQKETEITSLRQQLDQAKKNGEPSKIKELGEKISDYQADVKRLEDNEKNLNVEINSLRKQLKEKPIEAAAVKVVERTIIPVEVRSAIFEKVKSLYEGLLKLTDAEIQIFATDVSEEQYGEVVDGLNDAIGVLENIDRTVMEAHS